MLKSKRICKNTRLGAGKETCFGSLVWCCKPSKPCPIRDHVLRKINMDVDEYMELKKNWQKNLLIRRNIVKKIQ